MALIAGIATAAAREKSGSRSRGASEPARPGVVEIGRESRIILEFQDDNLTVFYLLEIVNNARTPIDIGGPLLIELPTGAAGASMMQGSSPQRQRAWRHADDHRAVRARQDDRRRSASRCRKPAQSLTIAQTVAGGAGAGVRRRREDRRHADVVAAADRHPRDDTRTAQPFIMAHRWPRRTPGDTLVLNLTGLPAHSQTPRNVGAGAGGADLRVGAWFAFSPAKAHAAQDAKLHARREKLLNDIVALERKRRQKPLSAAEEARLQRIDQRARARDRRARSRQAARAASRLRASRCGVTARHRVALTVVDVARHFGRRKALSQVTFTCEAGEIVGLLGPNGAGKSTLLNILATLLAPSKGSVEYGDRTAEQGGAACARSIGMLGHDLFLYPELTARENLTFFAQLYGLADVPARGRRARWSRPAWPSARTI